MIFDTELPYSSESDLGLLEQRLIGALKDFAAVVFVDGAQINVLERKTENFLIRFQFPIKSGEKPTEIQVRKLINQTLIDWSHEQRQA